MKISSQNSPLPPQSNPLRFLARYRGQLALGILCLLVTSSLGQTIPYLIKHAVDVIEGHLTTGRAGSAHQQTSLWIFPALVALFALGQAAMRIFSRVLIFNAGRQGEYHLRGMLFAHLCRLDAAFYRSFHTGEIMSRLTNDLAAVRALFGAGVLYTTNTVFAYAVALPLMLSIDPSLSLLALTPYPILLLGARAFARGIYQRSRQQQEALAHMTSTLQEDLAGIRELKSYRLEPIRAEAFRRESQGYLRHALRLAMWRSGMLPFVGAGTGASLVILLWVGGNRVIEGSLGLGDLVALNLYVTLLAWPTMAIGWMISVWQRGTAAWHRLQSILEARAELEDDPAAHGPSMGSSGVQLRLEGLTLEVGGRKVLNNINLGVRAGEILGVVGRVGSGKTLLIEAVARLLDVPPGVLYVGGEDATTLSLSATRRKIAYSPQDPFLFSATIRENILYGLDETPPSLEASLEEVVRAAGLETDIAHFPAGLDTMVGEHGVTLSGGQRQRVALARALVSQRPVLLLDDSLSAVDTETEREILRCLRQVLNERTVLLVSHRISALRHTDQIVVLENGSVAERGTHDQLIAAEGIYSLLYQEQLLETPEESP
ncbi:MAG: ABC transporter ATP-binding protein [Deltaproteobacteria bacterium]|nr:ABC transporter ATP-binding protein [Deltaproteobacteria bacterium]